MARKLQSKDWKHTLLRKSNSRNRIFKKDSLNCYQDEEDNSLDSQNHQLEEIFNQTIRDLESFHFYPPVDTSIYKQSQDPQIIPQESSPKESPQIRLEEGLPSHKLEVNAVLTKCELLPPISSGEMHMKRASNKTLKRIQPGECRLQMTAASTPCVSSTSNRSKRSDVSLTPSKSQCSLSHHQYVQDQVSLPKINLNQAVVGGSKPSSNKEHFKLPKIRKCHRDYFNSSSRNPDDIFHSVDKWLSEYSFGSPSLPQHSKQQMIVRPIEKIISMPHLQARSSMPPPTIDDNSLHCSIEKPKPHCPKSHSTIWILKESLKRLNSDVKKAAPKPLTHSDVSILISDKTVEQIHKLVPPQNKKKHMKRMTDIEVCTLGHKAYIKGKDCMTKRTTSEVKSAELEDTLPSALSSKKSNQSGASSVWNQAKQFSGSKTLSSPCDIATSGSSKPLSLSPHIETSLRKDSPKAMGKSLSLSAAGESKSSEKLMSGFLEQSKLSSHERSSAQKEAMQGSLPSHLQTPLWWVEM